MLTAIRGAGLFPFNISRRRQAIFQISSKELGSYAREKEMYVYLSWKSRQSVCMFFYIEWVVLFGVVTTGPAIEKLVF